MGDQDTPATTEELVPEAKRIKLMYKEAKKRADDLYNTRIADGDRAERDHRAYIEDAMTDMMREDKALRRKIAEVGVFYAVVEISFTVCKTHPIMNHHKLYAFFSTRARAEAAMPPGGVVQPKDGDPDPRPRLFSFVPIPAHKVQSLWLATYPLDPPSITV